MVTLAGLIKSTHSYTLLGVSNEPFFPHLKNILN